MSNQQLEEKQQHESDLCLAKSLGISMDDLDSLNYKVSQNTSDDGCLYGYIVEFNEDSPKEILDKISGLENNSYVYLSPNAFD